MTASQKLEKTIMKVKFLIFQFHQRPKVEILVAIAMSSKMIFLGDHTPLMKVLLQDRKILADMQEKLNYLIHTCEGIMSSSSNDTGYTESTEVDIETDPNLPPRASKSYTLPLKHQE